MAKTSDGAGGAWRVVGVTVLVSTLALWAALDSYDVSRRLSQEHPDPYGAASAHARMAPALALLPPAGEVAYLSDLGFDSAAGTAAFLTAQNALAPRLLVKSDTKPGPGWAIGNFSTPRDFAAYGRERGFEVLRDTGHGVVVYRRR